MASVLSTLLVLCFIKLTTGSKDNVALGKPASQSSNNYPDKGFAEAGVDGNLTTFIHTAIRQNFSWWKVDLEMVVQDAQVKLYLRTSYPVRRRGIRFYTSLTDFPPDPPAGHLCYTVTDTSLDVHTVICTGTWRHLMMYTDQIYDTEGSLMDFLEVEIYACFSAKYGPDCNKTCTDRQCQNQSSTCHHQTGVCVGGCRPGYIMADCSQACGQDLYGDGCALICADRKCAQITSSCHHETGKCEGGCQPGWNGTDCVAKCPSGTYGSDCRYSCVDRKCSVSTSECDHQNGTCSAGGCQAGWTGVDCTGVCPEGTYGTGCDKRCSNCVGDTCHHVTGICDCQPGWQGELCTGVCPDFTYGPGCDTQCGNCVGYTCHHVTGVCGCQPGWRGELCTEVCPDGTYGPGCGTQCGNCAGDTCHHVTGVCDCQPDWRGELCTEELTTCEGTITGVGVAVGVVIGAVVMLLIGCVALFCLRRTGRLLWKSESHSQTPAQTSALNDMTPGSVTKDRSHTSTQNVYEMPAYETVGKNDYDVINAKDYENL